MLLIVIAGAGPDAAVAVLPISRGSLVRRSQYSMQSQVLLEMLKTCRIKSKLRQADLGLRLGRDQALVSKVESGDRRLDVLELRDWIRAIGTNFVAFVTELDQRLRETESGFGSLFPGEAPSRSARRERPKRRP